MLTRDIIGETITDRDQWNDTLRQMPYAHVLQSWEWGQFKQTTTGWNPQRFAFKQGADVVAMASVGVRNVGPAKVMYVPKGPALDYQNPELLRAVLDELQAFARQQRAIWLKIDPDVVMGTGTHEEEDAQENATGQAIMGTLSKQSWRESADQVQFRNTVIVDLTQSEDDILMAMSQNTRRKVRTAMKKGVTVRPASEDDLTTLYELYSVTGERDEFLIRPPEYYEKAWRDFMRAGLAHALIAEHEGDALGHVILFHFGQKTWYFYGASSNEKRNLMPNYLLQWEAMRWAKAQGYTQYDMWGAPTHFNESDSMWGVYQFKRGFRGTTTRYIGAWDYAPNALAYRAYTQLMPAVISTMKRLR